MLDLHVAIHSVLDKFCGLEEKITRVHRVPKSNAVHAYML